jgi:hypothetical protein
MIPIVCLPGVDSGSIPAGSTGDALRHGLDWPGLPERSCPMAKPNYSFEKRQREIAKKKKKEEKLARKQPAKPFSNDAGEPTNAPGEAGGDTSQG